MSAQAPRRVGAEFQVNTYTTDVQAVAAAAVDGSGNFVVVWQSKGQDGSDYGIWARRFNSTGGGPTSPVRINLHTADAQRNAVVGRASDGKFTVVWESYGQDGSSYGIFAAMFTGSGAVLEPGFRVNTYTSLQQQNPAIAMDADGDFVVVWQGSHDGSEFGVFARLFNAAGTAQATEFQVNSYTLSSQTYPAAGMDPENGDFVVAWRSIGQDGDTLGIFAKRFNFAGLAEGGEFRVNSYTVGAQDRPAVAMRGDGSFVAAWQSAGQDGDFTGVFARRFNSTGVGQGGEFQVNTFTLSNQYRPTLAIEGDGDFVIAWQGGHFQDGNSYGVFGRRFDSTGAGQGGAFQINSYTTGNQGRPAIAMKGDGAFVVAWDSLGQDGSSEGVFAQRFALLADLDLDGSGTVDPLTDGLLILRSFFGFTGATLTNAAIDPDCTRCDAAAIGAYVSGLGLVLDIDGDGALEPLTDGLLSLRFLFGFTGATLVNGAVNAGDCTRCDATAIETYLETLN